MSKESGREREDTGSDGQAGAGGAHGSSGSERDARGPRVRPGSSNEILARNPEWNWCGEERDRGCGIGNKRFESMGVMGWGKVGLAFFSFQALITLPLGITAFHTSCCRCPRTCCAGSKRLVPCTYGLARGRGRSPSSSKGLFVSAVVAVFSARVYIYVEYNGAINLIHSGSCQYLNTEQLKSGWVVNLPYDISAEYAGSH